MKSLADEIKLVDIDKVTQYSHASVGLDFETYSGANLLKVGAHNYMEDPEFKPLLAAVATPDGVAVYDFVLYPQHLEEFDDFLYRNNSRITAHNAAFEMGVIKKAFPNAEKELWMLDSAVVASTLGLSRSLAASSAQILPFQKMEEGLDLIRLFSLPNERFDFKAPTAEVIKADPELWGKWELFRVYCAVDAELSRLLGRHSRRSAPLNVREIDRWRTTQSMNDVGWHVDLEMAKSFKRQYEKNVAKQLAEFRLLADPEEKLNLRSFPQQKKWCADRGVRAKSFNEDSVKKLHTAIVKQLDMLPPGDPRIKGYEDVAILMATKKELGGSSLSKLDTLINQTDPVTHQLHDQYLHAGASQTYRTTGRGVQMQNLKRLRNPVEITSSTIAEDEDWSNEQMADNLRQLFTASHPEGALIVGDFASVESRGLAWLAGEDWKLKAYTDKKDLYKVLASKIFDTPYEMVDKSQRQVGKVGELACGYGAGPGAVQSFAEGMGVELSRNEASQLVFDWREANSGITTFWQELQKLLELAVQGKEAEISVGPEFKEGYKIQVVPAESPESLTKLHPGVKDVHINITLWNDLLFTRMFRGVYKRGTDICYYKPTSLKTGDLWKSHFMDPKTKQKMYYKIYGGKLAGILTQSLCRELFFTALTTASQAFRTDTTSGPFAEEDHTQDTKLMGQFHDEIVVDWAPAEEEVRAGITFPPVTLEDTKKTLQTIMSRPFIGTAPLAGFPLEAEVNYSYRYIK